MIDLRLVTPYADGFEQQVDKIIVRGIMGDMMLMQGTAPIVTPLAYDAVRIFENGQEKKAVVHGGYVSMQNDVCTIATTAFEWTDDIDRERAEAAKKRAEEELRATESKERIKEAQLALYRALARLRHGRRR